MSKKTAAALGAALIIVTVTAIPAAAVGVDFTWDGGGGDDNWSTALNWDTDVAPGTDDNLIFNTGTTMVNDFAAPYVVGYLGLGSMGLDLSGNAISVNDQIFVYEQATVRTDLTAAQSQTWFVSSTAGFTVTGDVDSAAASVLNFQSDGDTVLDGELNGPGTALKTFAGVLYLNGGGNVPGIEVGEGGVHFNSVFSNTDVYLTEGSVSGGTPGNIGAQQAIAELVADGGTVAPGPGAYGTGLGTLYLGGSFTGSAAAALSIDIEGSTSDSVLGAGVFTANNTQLRLIVGTAPAIGDEFVIAETTDTTANSFFTKVGGGVLADGAVVPANGHFFRIDYRTVDIVLTYLGTTDPDAAAGAGLPPTGVDVTLPLIGTGVLALAGIALLLLARRRNA